MAPFPCRGYQELASPGSSVATSEDVSLAAWGCSSSLADSVESEAGSPQGEGCWGRAAAAPPLPGQGLHAKVAAGAAAQVAEEEAEDAEGRAAGFGPKATMLMLATAMHPPTRRWPRCRQSEAPSAPWGG